MRIVRLAAVALAALSLFIVACDDDGNGAATRTPAGSTTTSASPSAPADDVTPGSVTPPPVDTPSADEQEVTGIVGAVITATSRIEINQLSGADVREVEVTPQTQIRRAVGGTLTLAEIRPSDRILARGSVDGETLIATRVTLQEAVPGAQPGG
jgi:hypothetical protein